MKNRLGDLHTNKSWLDSLAELKDEFRKWGVEDYLLPTKRESEIARSVTVAFALRGTWVKPECRRWQTTDGQDWQERNIRAIVLAVKAARLADSRGLGALLAEISQPLALPDPNDPSVILGVPPDAPQSVIRQAYLDASKVHHPDKGGDPEQFKRVHDAGKALGVA